VFRHSNRAERLPKRRILPDYIKETLFHSQVYRLSFLCVKLTDAGHSLPAETRSRDLADISTLSYTKSGGQGSEYLPVTSSARIEVRERANVGQPSPIALGPSSVQLASLRSAW